MGICRVRLRRRVRYVQARHHSWHAAARERREVWVRVPYESEDERLRVYGVREAVNRRARIGTLTGNCTRHVPKLCIKGLSRELAAGSLVTGRVNVSERA